MSENQADQDYMVYHYLCHGNILKLILLGPRLPFSDIPISFSWFYIYIYMYAIIIPIISQLSILSPSSMATLITILPYVPSFRTNTFSIAKRGATRWRSLNIHQSLPLCMPRDELVIRSLCITLW